MIPISGPFITQESLAFSSKYRVGYRQAKPYNLPLLYRYDEEYGKNTTSMVFWDGSSYFPSPSKDTSFTAQSHADFPRYIAASRNRCYEKFKSEISESAGWAENLAQLGKSRDMFNKRAGQCANFFIAVRRFQFKKAAKILETPVPSKVSRNKKLSQNVLEFEYGLKPLISDMQNSLKILTSDPGARRVYVSDTFAYDAPETYTEVVNGTFFSRNVTIGIVCKTKYIAYVRVTNPNLFLANQFGLIDLALPWKLLPFSFIVDWFVNVEQMISSMTDFFGVVLERPATVEFSRGRRTYNTLQRPAAGGYTTVSIDQYSNQLLRGTSIPGPTLVIKPFQGFSLERGIQAMALVKAVFGK